MRYTICIQETVSDLFEVEASSQEEALEIAEEKYDKGEFVLEPGNLDDKQMCIFAPLQQVTDWREF